MSSVKYPVTAAALDRAARAAKIVGLPVEDLACLGLAKACEEIESTGQIVVKCWKKGGAK